MFLSKPGILFLIFLKTQEYIPESGIIFLKWKFYSWDLRNLYSWPGIIFLQISGIFCANRNIAEEYFARLRFSASNFLRE